MELYRECLSNSTCSYFQMWMYSVMGTANDIKINDYVVIATATANILVEQSFLLAVICPQNGWRNTTRSL